MHTHTHTFKHMHTGMFACTVNVCVCVCACNETADCFAIEICHWRLFIHSCQCVKVFIAHLSLRLYFACLGSNCDSDALTFTEENRKLFLYNL